MQAKTSRGNRCYDNDKDIEMKLCVKAAIQGRSVGQLCLETSGRTKRRHVARMLLSVIILTCDASFCQDPSFAKPRTPYLPFNFSHEQFHIPIGQFPLTATCRS